MRDDNRTVVIGGPHDGQRIPRRYAELPILRLPVYPRETSVISRKDGMPFLEPDLEIEEYIRQDFADSTGRVSAWVHPSVRSPMRELLSGYRCPLKEVKP